MIRITTRKERMFEFPSLTKQNRRRIAEWGKVLPAVFCIELYTYESKNYLTILDMKGNEFWALEIESEDDVLAVLMAWIDSRNLNISKITVLMDREAEFNCLDDVLKNLKLYGQL